MSDRLPMLWDPDDEPEFDDEPDSWCLAAYEARREGRRYVMRGDLIARANGGRSMTPGLPAAIRAARADDVELSELCERLRDAIEPRLRSLTRYLTTTARGRDDWDTSSVACRVSAAVDDAARTALKTHDPAVALAEAIRSAEAVADLEPETAAAVVQDWCDEVRAGREPDVVIDQLASGAPVGWPLPQKGA